MIRIDLFSDVICPWCFIGKRRLDRALAARPGLTAAIRWRAFQLNPDMPPDGMPRQRYLAAKFGGDARARQIYDGIAAAGAADGIAFAFEDIARTPNTVAAHRLIAWAGRQQRADAVAEALFQAYFCDGRDIGSIAGLADIAAGCDLDGEAARDWLASGDGMREVLAETRFAQANGITAVPCFIVNQRYAVSGAQQPEAFLPLLDLAQAENRDAAD